jgi:hypothetical protein
VRAPRGALGRAWRGRALTPRVWARVWARVCAQARLQVGSAATVPALLALVLDPPQHLWSEFLHGPELVGRVLVVGGQLSDVEELNSLDLLANAGRVRKVLGRAPDEVESDRLSLVRLLGIVVAVVQGSTYRSLQTTDGTALATRAIRPGVGHKRAGRAKSGSAVFTSRGIRYRC